MIEAGGGGHNLRGVDAAEIVEAKAASSKPEIYRDQLRRASEPLYPRVEHSPDAYLPLAPGTQECLPVGLVALQSELGVEKFSAAVSSSGGAAAIIVHPFFPEVSGELLYEPSRGAAYDKYVTTLRSSVERYQQRAIPIVLFAGVTGKGTGAQVEDLDRTVERLGLTTGEVFIVATHEDAPDPILGDLSELADQLASAGLTRATVNGSYLVKVPHPEGYLGKPGISTIAQKYQLEGCAGITAEDLLTAGIDARPGGATFSSSFLERVFIEDAQPPVVRARETITERETARKGHKKSPGPTKSK